MILLLVVHQSEYGRNDDGRKNTLRKREITSLILFCIDVAWIYYIYAIFCLCILYMHIAWTIIWLLFCHFIVSPCNHYATFQFADITILNSAILPFLHTSRFFDLPFWCLAILPSPSQIQFQILVKFQETKTTLNSQPLRFRYPFFSNNPNSVSPNPQSPFILFLKTITKKSGPHIKTSNLKVEYLKS